VVRSPPVAPGCVLVRPRWRQGIADHLPEVLVQVVDGRGVAVVLDVAVAVSRLADARVPELSLHPAEVGPALQEPGSERVSSGMVAAVDEPGLGEQRAPDAARE
jgi:hypothetical protein